MRDSLSAYTGVDLTDFFQFHIFTPGFVDYHLHLDEPGCMGNEVGVFVRQQGVGTTATPASSRVPVTFFSSTGDTAKRVLAFQGAEWYDVVNLPFEPSYYVLDYDCDFSDAATLAVFKRGVSSTVGSVAHVKLSGTLPEQGQLVVEHHWGHPWDVDTLTGLRRTTNRYWRVSGAEEQYWGLQGQFRFVRAGYPNGNYPDLDQGFAANTASLDSVVVLYRKSYGYPWQAVSHQRTGNDNEGYFLVDNLRTGEYTLAIVDTNLLSVPRTPFSALHPQPSLFPNPVAAGEALTLRVPVEGTFTLSVFDNEGRRVWRKRGCRNGQTVSPRLSPGIYIVQIENNCVSLQSKLIVNN